MTSHTAPAPQEGSGTDGEHISRPRLADDVVVHPPISADAPWIIRRGEQYLRVGADLAKLAGAADGTRGHRELAALLGPRWSAAAVDTAVRRLVVAKVFHGGADTGRGAPRRAPRLKVVPPLTVQLTVVHPRRLLSGVLPAMALLGLKRWGAVGALLAAGGLAALAALGPELAGVLGRPLPPSVYAGVLGAMLLASALHELAHAAVLAYYGGRPSRMGVMLFYLSPAFFCDVSDGWRLSRNEQRVRVALAGIATQWVIAGSAALAALAPPPGRWQDGLLLFAAAGYFAGTLNLLPVVRLDGYLALMSHLDVPHLRDLAMADARHRIARLLYGGRYRPELPRLRWAVPFGLACMAAPLFIVVPALGNFTALLQRTGTPGAVLMVCAAGYLTWLLLRGAVRTAAEARTAGAPRWRIALSATALTAAAVCALLFVRVPCTVAGGYTVRDGGRVELLLPSSVDPSAVHPGTAVQLYRAGLVGRTTTGEAVIGSGRATATTAPLSAFVPMTGTSLTLPAAGYPLTTTRPPAERTGNARLTLGRRPLARWLYDTYLAPCLR
ncbi:daptide biosynthesis intramembrane metalloprotease [Kitasatospora sp. NPDC088346]|uniref:daptide biosynthesis intramembrane metalloprotease n=1 Tax=Kitasatospora sp. NPDC088346 TaxID=3364073 RepID=UPI0037FD43D2